MRRLLISVLALTLVGSCFAQKWCFVVAGDGRANGKNSTREMDHNGINTVITSEIAQAVLNEHAKFLAWTGDLVSGYDDAPTFESQLNTWVDLMKPLYDAHVPVLPCRGNHDQSSKEADAVWDRIFSGPRALPQNGPADEKNKTWFYTEGDVLFLGLDQYTKGYELVDQAWLDRTLLKNKKPFVFAMGHEPAFMDGAHEDTLDSHPTMRDAFWESMIAAGSRVFFAGHDHIYDHMMIVRNAAASGPEMHQFVAGTAGAPFYQPGPYKGRDSVWKLARIKNIKETYGYILVTIDGKTCTIEFKGRTAPGVYETMDSWSYTVK